MHYITNAKNQIIAADEEFLNLLSIDDLTQIYQSLSNGEFSIEFGAENTLNIKTTLLEETYSINKIQLHSLVGELYMVELKEIKTLDINAGESLKTIEDNVEKQDDILDDIPLVDDISDNIELADEKSSDDLEISDDELFGLLLDNDDSTEHLISDIADEVDEVEIIEDKIISDESENEVFNLVEDEEENTQNTSIETPAVDTKPIVLDISLLSKTIGISEEDYKAFLDEYISTAKALEDDILGDDIDKKDSAISTLSHLSNVLHIPVVGDLLTKIKDSDNEEKKTLVQELYSSISRLTTDATTDDKSDEVSSESLNVVDEDEIKSDEPEVKPNDIVESKDENTQLYQSSVPSEHKIDLSGVKPIHFDFSMEEAASELSLPVDLIEEFVHDFIEQAHEETEKMLTAYDEGDLDKVNKIGHLLKGTSSNLRIVPLADTLYKIQFCESLDELEPLIKDYWGHFLAFENHIKLRTK